jgi:pSer/pThr/pTyr-binding forkhead associated (FHA) protein
VTASVDGDAQAAYEAARQQLDDEITRQQGIITQLEGVQSMLGPGTPAGVLQSLDEARAALAKAQSDLQALGGETSGTAQSQPATPTPAATTTATEPAAPSEPAAASAATTAPEAVAAPAPAGPRLTVDESGVDIALPADKSEYVIGREDPISGIFPEVDLTPYGGENGGVSRQHARLSRSGSQWMLTDLNSTNHTRVDGARLEPNTPTEVKDGSKLQFGRLALTFHA